MKNAINHPTAVSVLFLNLSSEFYAFCSFKAMDSCQMRLLIRDWLSVGWMAHPTDWHPNRWLSLYFHKPMHVCYLIHKDLRLCLFRMFIFEDALWGWLMFLAINYLEENMDSEITNPMVAVRIVTPATIIETLLKKYCFSECGLRTTWRWCPLLRYRIQKKVVDD